MAIVHSQDIPAMLEEIRKRAAEWRGQYVNVVSISLGCASHSERPEDSVSELEKLADARMYEDKSLYYQRSGRDRRRR